MEADFDLKLTARETIAVVKKAVTNTAAGISGLVESQRISDTIFAMDNK